DLFANLFLNGEFLSVPDVFSKYRLHSSSKTVLTNQYFAEDWQRVFCKVLTSIDRSRDFENQLKEIGLWRESESSYPRSKSIDNTEDALKAIGSSKVSYYKKNNEERGAARNFGIRKSTGQYITFLDSDDRMKQNHLAVLFTHLQQNKEDFIATKYSFFNENGS